jgi:uncharacterized repeat protein (TIGR03803 family)
MPMLSQALISLFRTIVLAGAAALLITSAALPMPAQSSVSPTAVQAARTPQYGSRLARPSGGPASQPIPARPRSRNRQGQDGFVYSNGPINGTEYAWTINFGFAVSDSFTVNNPDVTGLSFGAWLTPGDVLTSAEVSITSQPYSGTSYFDQTVRFTSSACALNQDGYNVCTETSTFRGPTLPQGTYWVNVQNAQVDNGDPVYWDQNDGPSQAYDSGIGTIPSESFTLLGAGGEPPCFGSDGNLQVIHDFTQQQAGMFTASGVTIDGADNLYGTTANGGDNSAGFAYKLTDLSGWLLDPLFSFVGGSTGGQPTGAILGPNGSLYGGAQGGIQNCGTDGSQYCGLVFNLRPKPTICGSALCGWNENVLYRFSSETDGSGTVDVSAFDQAGNLYGTTSTGGAYGGGTVFELTPSGGGWTKTTLYSFTTPHQQGQVLAGNDGNVYGVANGGIYSAGVVFQLTPSGGQWTESIIHAFSGGGIDGDSPAYLVQDSAGNLSGIADSVIFTLEKTNSGWLFSKYFVTHGGEYDELNNLTIDAAGNLYGTGAGGDNDPPSGNYSYIFTARLTGAVWHYHDLDYLGYQNFPASGSLALDASGNLYGTTFGCGAYNRGTVWKLSP